MDTNDRLNEFMVNIELPDFSMRKSFIDMFKEIAMETLPEFIKIQATLDDIAEDYNYNKAPDYCMLIEKLEDIQSAAADAKIKMVEALR